MPKSKKEKIWFWLVDTNGDPYKQARVAAVRCPAETDVEELCVAIKQAAPNDLAAVDAHRMFVYKDRSALGLGQPLRLSTPVASLATSDDQPLLVVPRDVPAVSQPQHPDKDNRNHQHGLNSSPAVVLQAIDHLLEKHLKPSRSSVSVSSFTSTRMYEAMTALGCSLLAKKVNEPVVLESVKVPGYTWIENIAEDHVVQREGYMRYLDQYLGSKLPNDYCLVDVASKKTLLSLHDMRLPFNITGGTDVLISEIPDDDFSMLSSVRIIIELKKSVQDANTPQAIAELISADAKADLNHPVVAVLTDLNNCWIMCWFTEGGICFTKFKEPKNAIDFVLDILRLPAGDKTIPLDGCTMKQIKLDDIRPRVIDTNAIDQYESLELLKNDELDEDEMRDIQEQQKKIALRLVLDQPIFHSTYYSPTQ